MKESLLSEQNLVQIGLLQSFNIQTVSCDRRSDTKVLIPTLLSTLVRILLSSVIILEMLDICLDLIVGNFIVLIKRSFSQDSNHQSPSSARSMNMHRMEEADYVDTNEFLNPEKDDESGSKSGELESQDENVEVEVEVENGKVAPKEKEKEKSKGKCKDGEHEDLSVASVLCGLTTG
jgi:hypothetical protein